VGANGIPAAPTAAPHFISSSQTIRAEVGETVRLPCDVQSLGKRKILDGHLLLGNQMAPT